MNQEKPAPDAAQGGADADAGPNTKHAPSAGLVPGALPWNGGCRCGKLRFRIVAPPMVTAVCHCRGCQRMSSSAYSLTLIMSHPGLEIIQGDPVLGGMRAPDLQHNFCDDCKTWVFTRINEFGIVNVRATLLDDARWFVPYLETYAATKLPWVETPAVERFDEFPAPETFPKMMGAYAAWAQARGWPVTGS
jgi:hypothetical protein